MADKSWKAFERVVARFFGTERNPLSGENSRHHTNSDSLHPTLYIECKRDLSIFPKKLIDLIMDTEEKASQEGKIPIIALKQHRRKGFYMLIHSADVLDVASEVVEE
jgi:hypothetical protein